MKSKIFGFSAKLALAVLALSGTMLTGCYETEDGDIRLAPELPAPVYTITGQVIDGATGDGLPGVTVNSVTTDALGNYQYTIATHGSHEVIFTKTDYKSEKVTVPVLELKKGQAASYNVSAVMYPTGYTPTLSCTSAQVTSYYKLVKFFDADTEEGKLVDLVNKTTSPVTHKLAFEAEWGAKYAEAISTSISAEFKAAIANYFGSSVSTDFAKVTHNYDLMVLPLSSVQSVTVETFCKTTEYSFVFGEETTKVKVDDAFAASFSNIQRDESHGHGHGHGHSDALNAGGGIVTPLI